MQMTREVTIDHLVPSHESLELTRLFARERDHATDVAEHEGIADLSAGDCRHSFIERGDAGLDLAVEQQRAPEQGERRRLHFDRVKASGDSEGGLRVCMHVGWGGRSAAARQLEPSVLRALLPVTDQALGARYPAVAGGLVSHGLDVFACKPERDGGGACGIPSLADGRVRPFSVLDRSIDVTEPPNVSAEAVPSLGRGPLGNGRFEGLLRAVPVAGHERFFASGHQISDHLTSHGKIMSLGAGFSTHPLSAFNFVSEVSNLYRIHPDGSGLEQLTRHDTGHFRATQPRYTPDGEWILLTTVTPSSRSLWAHPRRGR
jgi:hypothetical protein